MAKKLTDEEKKQREEEKQRQKEEKEKQKEEEKKRREAEKIQKEKDRQRKKNEESMMKLKAKLEKPVILRPAVPKRKQQETEPAKSKRSVIVHKSEKPAQNLYDLLNETESTIEELSRIYAELPDGKHYGVGGTMKPTLKQQVIADQIKQAQKRAERVMKMIEKM